MTGLPPDTSWKFTVGEGTLMCRDSHPSVLLSGRNDMSARATICQFEDKTGG